MTKNFGVVLFDRRTDKICIMEHNLNPWQAEASVSRYRGHKLPAFKFPHEGLHEEPNAELCTDCVDVLAAITKQAGKKEAVNGKERS